MTEELEIRPSIVEDGEMFKNLLLQPDVLRYFPMYDLREIEDSIRVWEIFCKRGASITSLVGQEPCGIAFLNLQAYKKFEHQCLITIIVDAKHRNKGIGTRLLTDLHTLAKDKFQLELLHLEVYEGNPAINLYRRAGYTVYGEQRKFTKENKRYYSKILMQHPL